LIVIVDVGAEGDRSADRRQDVERVADFVLVDVAGAERVADDLAPGDYGTELDLVIDETADTHIAWRRLASGDLVREERTGTTVTAQDTMLGATTEPVFSYHDGTGTEIDPLVDGVAAIGQCTTRIRVDLVTSGDGDTIASAVVDAPLVQHSAVPDPCP
ncbi:MAG: hypothetical protein GY939_28695, partial [Actinomycetia bacterium]|nr:hypothetical protein [Actinomycetes bacterium]